LKVHADQTSLIDRLSALAQAPWLRWLLVAALVMLYTSWIGYVIHYNKPVDFYVYYSAALASHQGHNVYELDAETWGNLGGFPGIPFNDIPYPYRYPPFFYVGMTPFTLLPPRVAATVWALASGVALIGSAWLLSRTFHTPQSEVVMLVLLGLSVPALATVHVGQVTALVLLCLVLSLYAYKKNRPVWAGLALGAAVLLKLIPIALVAYMFWRRQFKATLVAVLVVVAAILISLPLAGLDDYTSYTRLAGVLARADVLTTTPPNQSLGGFIGRFSWFLPGDSALYLKVIRVLNLCFVIATILLCWPPGDFAHRVSLEFGLVVVTLQLITPFAWLHQLILLLIPLGVLAYKILTEKRKRFLVLPVAVACVLIDIQGLFWHQLMPYTLLLSLGTYGTLILWGVLAWLLLRNSRGPPSLAPQPDQMRFNVDNLKGSAREQAPPRAT